MQDSQSKTELQSPSSESANIAEKVAVNDAEPIEEQVDEANVTNPNNFKMKVIKINMSGISHSRSRSDLNTKQNSNFTSH